MADTKITALTAIGANPIIPSTFPIPMVDLTDTSMAASGTTKKVTVNQILGAGGTATLASATITGNATAAAFIPSGSTVPTNGLYLPSANSLGFAYNSTLGMTLNSTGLLVGTTVANSKLTVASASLPTASWGIASIFSNDAMAIDKGGSLVFGGSFTGSTATYFAQIAGRKENSTDADVAGYLAFSTRPTGGLTTERLRIDSSGNVGIGVTPSAWQSGLKALQFGGNGVLYANGTNTAFVGSNYYTDSGGTNRYLVNGVAAAYGQVSAAHQWYTAPSGTAGNPISGANAFVQTMTLDASGNLLVGKTASSTTVAGSQVQPDGTFSAVKGDANPGFFYNRSTAASGTIALFRSNSVTVGSITQDGTNTSYVTTSDYRLKESVQPLVGGLARVNALKPSIYKWKANGSSGEGFIAHELAEVVPSAVAGEKDAVNEDGSIKAQGVDLSKVVPILVAAIQELAAEVNALKNA